MGTYTTNYNLYKPTVGEQGWGTLVNTNFTTIDTTLKAANNDIDTIYLTTPVINTVNLTTPTTSTSIFTVPNGKSVIGISINITSATSKNYDNFSIVDNTDTMLLEPFDIPSGKTGTLSGASYSYSNFSGSNKGIYIISDNITWVVSTAITGARSNASGFGLQSSCVAAGGSTYNGETDSGSVNTYVFNGSTWSTSGNLNTARHGSPACGLQSAGIVSSGYQYSNYTKIVEKYNGSTWTSEATQFPQAVAFGAAAGYQSSTIHYGGTGVSSYQSTYKYDGSTWTLSGYLTQPKYFHGGCGTASSAIAVGGITTSGASSAVCSLFNGATWIISPSVSVGGGTSVFGKTVSSVISVGTYVSMPEYYDGAVWRVISSLNTPRTGPCTIGSKNFGFVYDGQTSGTTRTTVTEKTAHVISSGAFTVKIITT